MVVASFVCNADRSNLLEIDGVLQLHGLPGSPGKDFNHPEESATAFGAELPAVAQRLAGENGALDGSFVCFVSLLAEFAEEKRCKMLEVDVFCRSLDAFRCWTSTESHAMILWW